MNVVKRVIAAADKYMPYTVFGVVATVLFAIALYETLLELFRSMLG